MFLFCLHLFPSSNYATHSTKAIGVGKCLFYNSEPKQLQNQPSTVSLFRSMWAKETYTTSFSDVDPLRLIHQSHTFSNPQIIVIIHSCHYDLPSQKAISMSWTKSWTTTTNPTKTDQRTTTQIPRVARRQVSPALRRPQQHSLPRVITDRRSDHYQLMEGTSPAKNRLTNSSSTAHHQLITIQSTAHK